MEINLSNLTKKEAFIQTLNHMPRTFSSYQFGIFVRQHGFDLPKNGGTDIGDFLKARKDCKRISNRVYIKKYEDHTMDAAPYFNPKKVVTESDIFATKVESKIKSVADFLDQLPIDTLIEYIISKGFLVLKK